MFSQLLFALESHPPGNLNKLPSRGEGFYVETLVNQFEKDSQHQLLSLEITTQGGLCL